MFRDDVGVEADAAIGGLFPVDALDFGAQTGEFVLERFEGEHVVDHRGGLAADALAGNDQGDAGRVDQHQRGRDPTTDLADRQVIDLVAGQELGRFLRAQHEFGHVVGFELLMLQAADVVVTVEAVHLAAEVTQAEFAVAGRPLFDEVGDDVAQFGVFIVQALEGDEPAQQRAGLAALDARGEQEEDAVKVVLLRHDAVLAQVFGEQDGRERRAPDTGR